MFSLELVAGQLVLPVFGGVPAVWATTLCFFTGVLFAGYLYAHLLISRVPVRRGVLIHLCVAVIAVAGTIAAPGHVATLRLPGLADAPNVLLVLALVAGAPAFLFSATTPLLSAWYARMRASARGEHPGAGTGRARGADRPGASAIDEDRRAFWLYAASNGASLAAVLGYPFLVQPFVPLSVQRTLVIAAVVALGALLVAIAPRVRALADTPVTTRTTAAAAAGASGAAGAREVTTAATSVAILTTGRQLRWLAAAFVPAGLLSATTTAITADLVAAPLLWIWPLAIYLVSFVVAFSESGRRLLPRIERLVPAAATLLWVPSLVFGSWPAIPLLLVMLSSFGVLACAIHGRLAEDRPPEAHLTRFYLVVSAGGVLATAFVAVVAPLVFPDIFEYPILIVGGLGVLAATRGAIENAPWAPSRAWRPLAAAAIRRVVPYGTLGLLFLVLVLDQGDQALTVAVLLAVGAGVIVVARSYRTLALLSGAAIVLLSLALWANPLLQQRTFFGVLQVRVSNGGAARAEYSGATLHGVQFTDARRTIPTSYYVRNGPLGDVFDDLASRLPAASIGVVGLGTGTIAAYERATDSMTFFEIDPAVAAIARDGRWFTYLADAPGPVPIVMGDARLSLGAEPAASFDVLVLDAFSSDNVPAHLLTREAIEGYRRVMRPGGIIVFHVSNRAYDLSPGVVSTAQSMGLAALQLAYMPGPTRIRDEAASASDWVVVGDYANITRFSRRGWGTPRPGPVLTDDFSDVLRMLRGFPLP